MGTGATLMTLGIRISHYILCRIKSFIKYFLFRLKSEHDLQLLLSFEALPEPEPKALKT